MMKNQKDIYIHHSDLYSAMNNDIVIVRMEKKESQEIIVLKVLVIRILERAYNQIVGTFEDNHSFGFVIADDKRIPNDIFIPKNKTNGALTVIKSLLTLRNIQKEEKVLKVKSFKFSVIKMIQVLILFPLFINMGLKLTFRKMY